MEAELRVGILVVAYNAEATLAWVLDRIPASFRPRITAILVSDDFSADGTHAVGLDLQQRLTDLPLTIVRQPRNLGYGGNQKFGYRWAVEQQLDVVVLLHGDGQYAPEVLPDIVAPLLEGRADVVLGSRMMRRGDARQGGMPRYKYVGNRILTAVQNRVAGLQLSEWHSGYRAFSVQALAGIPFAANSDGFDFDTEVLLQLHHAGARIVEVPIPTYYGDEICHVDGLRYARDVLFDVARYRAQRIGFGSDSLLPRDHAYVSSTAADSSQVRLLTWAGARPGGRALDLGCGDGTVGARLRDLGYEVTAVDAVLTEGAKERVDRFVLADLDDGIPAEVGDGPGFDIVVAADVVEHLKAPERLLAELHALVRPGGRVLLSVPNFGHWYVRARVVAGRFDYDRRGILDRGHLRFFTARSFERLLRGGGWHIVRTDATGLPFDVVDRGGQRGLGQTIRRGVGWLDAAAVRARRTLFGYQLLYELEPA